MSETLNRGGRPPKDENEKLSEVLHARFTPPEADVIHCAAIRAGMSTNTYLRELVRAAKAAGVLVSRKPREASF